MTAAILAGKFSPLFYTAVNTPSHAILNLVILSKLLPADSPAVIAGAILPDLPIFGFYLWAKFIARVPARQIWEETYWHPAWQNVFAAFHSIPLAMAGWLIAGWGGWVSAQTVFLSMVLHSLFDLPVHNSDAHRHFFPLSNYRFISPISYWDVKRHGAIVALVELFLVLAATLYLFPGTQSLTGQGLLAIINIIYASGYFWFYLRERVPVGRARSHKKPGFLKEPGFGNN